MEMSQKSMEVALEAGRRINVDVQPYTHDGREGLPLLEGKGGLQKEPVVTAATVTKGEFEEWAQRVQLEVDRVTGGAGSEFLSLENAPPSMSSPARGRTPRSRVKADKPEGFVEFWHRDGLDSRPAMPAMPSLQ